MKWTASIAYLACVGLLIGCSDDVAPAAPAADSPDATFEDPPAQGPLSVEITAPASGTVFSNQVPVVVAATMLMDAISGAIRRRIMEGAGARDLGRIL